MRVDPGTIPAEAYGRGFGFTGIYRIVYMRIDRHWYTGMAYATTVYPDFAGYPEHSRIQDAHITVSRQHRYSKHYRMPASNTTKRPHSHKLN